LLDSILNHKYKVIRGIYRDDSGSIYLVNELNSNKTYTMKELLAINENSTVIKELKQVAERTVKIDKGRDSPRIIDFFTDSSKSYLVVDGNDERSLERLKVYFSLGKILKGRYVVVRGIASGGFGTVYLVRDISLPGKFWALKEMHDDSDNQEVIEKSFKIEAEMLARLDHISIPRVTDFFVEGRRLFLVMDYIEGESLRRLLTDLPEDGYFPEEKILDWSFQMCDVLHYLHNRPEAIIFRDLKPDNILLTADGKLKLIDFGIARVFEASKKVNTRYALLTEGYAPQEQWLGKAEPRSDIYSLGATLFYLSTKIHPREVAPDFPPLHTLNKNISAGFSKIILKALEPKISDRYENILLMKRDLLDCKKERETCEARVIHLEKARNYKKEKEYLKASFEYMKVIEFNKNDSEALMSIGECYEALGLKDKALEHYVGILNEPLDAVFKGKIQEKISSIAPSKKTLHLKEEDETLRVTLTPEGEIKTGEILIKKGGSEEPVFDEKKEKEEIRNGSVSKKIPEEKCLKEYTGIVENAFIEGKAEERGGYIEEKRVELGISEDKSTKIINEVKKRLTASLPAPPRPDKKKKKSFPVFASVAIIFLLAGVFLFALYKAGIIGTPTPEALCGRAERLISDGNYKEALGVYRGAYEKFPENEEIWEGLSGLYIKIGDITAGEEAMENYKGALSLSPDDTVRRKLLKGYFETGNTDDFYKMFSDISAHDRNDLGFLIKLLLVTIEKRDSKSFEKLFEALIAHRSSITDKDLIPLKKACIAWSNSLITEEADPDRAKEMLNYVREINIKEEEEALGSAYIRLLDKYIETGGPDRGENLLKELEGEGLEKEKPVLYEKTGRAYMKPEINNETVESLKNKIDKNKMAFIEKLVDAEIDLQELEKLLRENKFAHKEVNMVLAESVNFKKAIEYFEKSLEVKPDNQEAALLLARCYFENREFDKAIKKAERAGESFEAFMIIGDSYSKKNDWKNSINWYKKATDLSLSPEDKEQLAEAYFAKGEEFFKEKKYEEARECFDNVKSLLPDDRKGFKDSEQYLKKIDVATYVPPYTGGDTVVWSSGGGNSGGGNSGGGNSGVDLGTH